MSEEARDLNVWLGGRVVADLTVNRRQVAQLRYRDDYVAERGEGHSGSLFPCGSAAAGSGETWSIAG